MPGSGQGRKAPPHLGARFQVKNLERRGEELVPRAELPAYLVQLLATSLSRAHRKGVPM